VCYADVFSEDVPSPIRIRASVRSAAVSPLGLALCVTITLGCVSNHAGPDAAQATEAMAAGEYWQVLDRDLAMTPDGNGVAIVCHNCYADDLGTADANMHATCERIHAAQEGGADLIELDVKLEDDVWRVGHKDDGSTTAAILEDVLRDEMLREGDQVLFIEIKDRHVPIERVRDLLSAVMDTGLARPNRPLILRAFPSRRPALEHALQLLDDEFLDYRSFVRMHALYTRSQTDSDDMDARLEEITSTGFSAVEFDRESENIFDVLKSARQRGLGTNVWNVDHETQVQSCREFREVSDTITIEYPFQACRDAIEQP